MSILDDPILISEVLYHAQKLDMRGLFPSGSRLGLEIRGRSEKTLVAVRRRLEASGQLKIRSKPDMRGNNANRAFREDEDGPCRGDSLGIEHAKQVAARITAVRLAKIAKLLRGSLCDHLNPDELDAALDPGPGKRSRRQYLGARA